jgi:sulfur-oxidizing protein SoxX
MRKTAKAVLGTSAAVLLLGAVATTPAVHAAGQVPDAKVCNDKANPPKDAVTKGGCVVLDRRKGNCMACHQVAGIASGNVAPPLVAMQARFPDKAKLRAQIDDATKLNPKTVMPPFGRHEILTKDEIDQVVEFVLTL